MAVHFGPVLSGSCRLNTVHLCEGRIFVCYIFVRLFVLLFVFFYLFQVRNHEETGSDNLLDRKTVCSKTSRLFVRCERDRERERKREIEIVLSRLVAETSLKFVFLGK
ncbi:uncharacterized protein LOC143017645 [Oratosquilla oratoria]|uniref:uncharacterized protein LOC143017645 n=1 Tax=Oratosquilla oratoria TaxID=337810 RepID=UPI003F778122